MISFLTGKILEKGQSFVVLQAGQIGYKVFVTPELLEKKVGDELSVYTYLKTSDDGMSLFGLVDFSTLQFFELLLTVSGVGPKVALAILSAARPEAVKRAITEQDAAAFTRVAGVGMKTAERIIVELKNKVTSMEGESASFASETYDALLALGYNQREARQAMTGVDTSVSAAQQLKAALKNLGREQ